MTRDAIAKRMQGLSCSQSAAVIDMLCIRMPPPFGSQPEVSPPLQPRPSRTPRSSA
jgi:hypothetical protein